MSIQNFLPTLLLRIIWVTTILHNLHDVQITRKRIVDRHHLNSSKFRVGNRVWILQNNIKTTRPCDKLDYQCFGSYVITSKISDVAFCLASLLTCVFTRCFMYPFWNLTPQVQFRDILQLPHKISIVAILDSKKSWEPAKNLANAPDMVTNFIANILVNHILVQTMRPVIRVVEEGG